jgi:dihydrofolate reductase
MRVELVAAISLDGKIAQSADQISLEWTSKEDKRFFVSKTKEAGVLVMGRTTYDTIGRPLPNRLNIIMTRDPAKFENIVGELEYTSKSPKDILNDLSDRGFEKVVIAGGSHVYSQFIKAGLITDLYLTVEPILFGAGISLIDGVDPVELKLKTVEKLGEHAVLLHYTV